MPITFRCASCSQVLKVADTLAGGKGKGPKCGAVLLIPGTKTEVPKAPARPAADKARPPQPAIIEEKAVPMRPRAAKAPSDDGDAAQEAVPRSRDVRKKKKKRKTSPLLFYGLLGGGFALLLVGSGIGVLTWWFSSTFRPGDDLTYMPSNCQTITSIHLDQLMQSQVFQELRREIPEIDKEFKPGFDKDVGLSTTDIEQMVVGTGPSDKDVVCVLHTKKDVEARDLRSRIKNGNYTETKVGKYVMQEPQNNLSPAFCVLEKKRLVLGDKEALRAVLLRDKKPEFSKNLQEALKQVDFSKTIAFASDKQSGPAQLGGGFPFLGAKNDIVSAQKKIDGFAVQATVGSDVRLQMALLCADAAGANEVKKTIEGFLNEIKKLIESFQAIAGDKQGMAKEVADLLQLNLKVEGNKVTGGNTFKIGALLKMYKQQKGKF